MAYTFQAAEGALWAQINGPNTQPVYLGCHQLGDVAEPQGDVELITCRDPSGPRRFRVVGSIQGAPGAVTTTVTTDVTDELDYLERAKCPITLFINMVSSGRPDTFSNFDRSFVLTDARVTNRGLSNLVARSEGDNARSEQTFDLSGEELLRIVDLSINTQSNSEAAAINDVTFCNEERCRTSEVTFLDACQTGFAVCDFLNGSPATTADVLKTTNGATWTATTDPFSAGESAIAVECFELGRDSIRVIVARGTTDAGNPAEIAYSDNSGTSWTTVNVGSDNGEFAPSRHSLFALDRNNIWLGTDSGRIYFSDDAGLTWTAVEDQVIHTGLWHAVDFIDENVGWACGAANIIAKTIDGGTSWSTVTGPSAENANDAITIEVLDRNRVWVGYSSGKLYYTLDGGTTWTERAFSGGGVGEIRDIEFLNDLYGYILHNSANPAAGGSRVLYTIDGGYSWTAMTTPTNTGLNALFICNLWSFFVVGEVTAGTAFIAKGSV